jgi:hypothetical protein
MPPPAPTARTTPTAKKPGTGYKILITFALDPDIEIWEKTVKPSGMDGGDPIDTTTQHNNVVRTKAPRALIENTDITITCTYNPVAIGSIRAILNKETTVTTRWWDGSTYAQYGFLRTFEPGDVAEDGQPEGTLTVSITNQDPTTGAVEEGVYAAPPAGFAGPMGEGAEAQTYEGEEEPEQGQGQEQQPQRLRQEVQRPPRARPPR